jgi:transposase
LPKGSKTCVHRIGRPRPRRCVILFAPRRPGIERQPLKKFDANEDTLLKLLHRWRREASQAGRDIKRIVAAYEAGRDGFCLARWLRARDVEVYVIHPTSIAVSREHRRAKL